MTVEVHTLRLNYDNGIIETISWVEGKSNTAEPLTKPHAGETAGILD